MANNKKFVVLLVTMLLFVSTFSFLSNATSNSDSYVIVVAPQEAEEWEPAIDKLLEYHPDAVVLILPENIQATVMEVGRQYKCLLMSGSLKTYLFYAYYVWGIRSIPVPWGYIYSGSQLENQAIQYLDRQKAHIRSLFHNWFEQELGYQPHYIAFVGDIKTTREDWVSALGMETWWDDTLPYPADAWPSSINAGQVPVAYLPFVVDECLAWYGYAVGRITGLTVQDAVDLVERAGEYNDWASDHLATASRFLASFTVGVNNYYSQLPSLLTDAGFNLAWYAPEGPYSTWDNTWTELDQGVGYWHTTNHGNFMTGMGGPGNGLMTFLIPGAEEYYYDIPIGIGWSGEIWHLINNDYLQSITSSGIDAGAIPALDHTIVRVSNCMAGSSEMPLQLVSLGAAAVIMGIPSQEVCQCDCSESYFWNALTHENPDTGSQFSVGEAMAYANVNTHVLSYYYGAYGMIYYSSMYLIGDPALVPYVPTVDGYPQPLDPPGNNPGKHQGGSQQVEYYVPMAIQAPDGTIHIVNICDIKPSSVERPK